MYTTLACSFEKIHNNKYIPTQNSRRAHGIITGRRHARTQACAKKKYMLAHPQKNSIKYTSTHTHLHMHSTPALTISHPFVRGRPPRDKFDQAALRSAGPQRRYICPPEHTKTTRMFGN